MKIRNKYTSLFFSVLMLALMGLSSCNHDPNHPGWAYMPDMYYAEPSEAYSASTVFQDSMSNQLPVAGTIPRNHLPYPFKERTPENQTKAGEELVNPIEANEKNLARGKVKYDIYCSSCHGEKGDGMGHLFTSKLFPAKPTSLIDAYVQDKPDGELFHVITVGSLSGLMGSHGSQVKSDDRWRIIHYLRSELAKK